MRSKLKIITAFIIGAVVFGSLGVYAASKIYSNQVEIDKTGGKLANVNGTKLQDALDYLYSQVGKCPEGNICYNASSFTHNLQIGDLVKMTPTLSTFTTDTSMTGYSVTQTINPQELEYWRVIRKNCDGTVDVVSEYVSSVPIYFGGVAGYKNFIGYLNTLASKYENSNYTVGSRHMGYNPDFATQILISTAKYDASSNSRPFPYSTSAETILADEQQGSGDIGYVTDFKLVKAAYGGVDNSYARAYKAGTTSAQSYWVASRKYDAGSDKTWYLEARYITCRENYANITNASLINHYDSGWSMIRNGSAIRPILTLKSNITAKSGDGKSEATAYVLG